MPVEAAPVSNVVIPVTSGTPPAAASQEPAGGTGQPSVGTQFSIPDTFKDKGWKGPDDVFKSYGELEKTYSQIQNQLNEYADYFRSIAPIAGDIDAFVAEKMAALTGKAPDNKSGKGIDPALEQRLLANERAVQEQNERTIMTAKSNASDEFQRAHPEHEQYRQEIMDILKSGIVQSSDPANVRANVTAYESALFIAKQRAADKAERAKAAAGVHGASGDLRGGGNVDMSNLDSVRDSLKT